MKNMIKDITGKFFALLPLIAVPLLNGCEPEPLEADLPQEGVSAVTAAPTFVYPGEESGIAHRWQGSDMVFELRQGKGMHESFTATFVDDADVLAGMVKKYADYKDADIFSLLPSECYTLPVTVTLSPDKEKADVTVSVINPPTGTYVLPLVLMSDEKEIGVQYVEVVNIPASDIDMSWLDREPSVTQPRFVAIVEAAENDIRNAGNYMLYPDGTDSPQTKRPLFDMVVLFSANMNFNEYTSSPELYFNDNIRRVLDNRDIFITPLQDKGIKVLLSVMPNHQAIGFSNMDISGDRKMITDFAKEVYDAVQEYGLDGVMFDDEYADYPTTPESEQPGRPMVQMGSFHFFIKALRDLMPVVEGQAWKDRHNLITLYNIGPSTNALTGGGGWCLFSNNFDIIRNGSKAGSSKWDDDRITADMRSVKEWVSDPANEPVLEEIAQIKAGEIFDYIWNANYARGDRHDQVGVGSSGQDYDNMPIAGLTEELAKQKYGLAAFEMSLEIGQLGNIQHMAKYWQRAYDSDTEGRIEEISATLANQARYGYESVICFNLQYVPDVWKDSPNTNLYLQDFPMFMQGFGYTGSPAVTFEGTNYDTVMSSYLK